MNMERPKFDFTISDVDREHGHVLIQYGGTIYKWFLRDDGRTVILVNGDDRTLSKEVRDAMVTRTRAILGRSGSDKRPAEAKE
jgi:hypothetical protein